VAGEPTVMPLRCRLGLHKWVRIKVVDPEPGQDPWETRCRYCQEKRRYWFKGDRVLPPTG
jgi:hypothetical protein